jgi:hypothetical protein
MKVSDVKAGQFWKRPNGTVLKLEYVRNGYATYWLDKGSRPQHRDIRVEMLLKRYTLMEKMC